MFYTVTVNPSLDYVMNVEGIEIGETNRSSKESISVGGKGINVSIMLEHLGIKSCAMAFVAGFTGDEIERLLLKQGVTADFIHLDKGLSRINLKLHSKKAGDKGQAAVRYAASGEAACCRMSVSRGSPIIETEINGAGPKISKKDIDELLGRLDALSSGDTLVLSGNIPPSLSPSFYSDIMKRQSGKDVRITVDATGQLLRECLSNKPFLVKPNTAELGALYGAALKTQDDVEPYAVRLREEGARNVLVSMGKYGAVLAADDGKVYRASAPRGQAVNTAGSGDSMTAGFLAGYDGNIEWLKNGCYDALVAGICAGSASAFEEGLASGEAVRRVYAAFIEGGN